MWTRFVFCLAGVLLSGAVFSQVDPDAEQSPGDVQKERAKFHAPVVGTSADARKKSYADRLAAEAGSPFGGILWRNVGPERQGGRVVDIQAPADKPGSLYVAYATGGLYRTEDDGATWTSLFDNQASFGIGAIALSKDGKTIWVGSGEANSQRTSYAGDGVYKSTDAGKTWQNMGLPESQHIGKILIDPRNPDVVWVAALGHLYSENPERGVYKSVDGGKTWRLVLSIDQNTGCIDMVLDPRRPDTVIASMWDRDRRAWDFLESGKGSAAYETFDGGRTWQKAVGLPVAEDAGRIGLAVCQSKPEVVYALADNKGEDPDWADEDEHIPSGSLTPRRFLLLDENLFLQLDPKVASAFFQRYHAGDLKPEDVQGQVKDKKLTFAALVEMVKKANPRAFDKGNAGAEVYRSDDFGRHWARVASGKLGDFGGYYWGKIWVNPKDPDDIYAMGVLLAHSTDGGKSWSLAASRAHVDFHAVWNDARQDGKCWFGCDGGLYLSYDGGNTVRPMNNLPVGQATTLAVDSHSPYRISIGLQDNGTMRGSSNYRPGQSDPNQWEDLFGGDGSAVAVDPRDSVDIVYVAAQFGESMARSFKPTIDTWSTRPRPVTGEPAQRFNWVSPFVVSPSSWDIVYAGSQRLYRSFDQGHHWTPISPDLTKNAANGNVPYSTIKDVSESPLRFGLIYVGCDDGAVKMTPDGGFQWIDIATPQPSKWVSRVVASKWNESTVYCAQSGYREDDFAAYLWKSTDYGKTWKSIVGDLPAETINVVREDPTRKDLLYVGTDMGVFVSFDDGSHWEPLQGGIPHTPVHDLAIQDREKDLVAATHSRSVWILPLKWVYQLTPDIRKTDLTLFDVDSVTRSANWGYESLEPWDRPNLTNRVARVNFYAKDPGSVKVEMDGKDGKAVVTKTISAVRGFNFVELSLQTKPPAPGAAKVQGRKIATASDALLDPREAERAQYVPVGDYVIVITEGGKSVKKPFKLTSD